MGERGSRCTYDDDEAERRLALLGDLEVVMASAQERRIQVDAEGGIELECWGGSEAITATASCHTHTVRLQLRFLRDNAPPCLMASWALSLKKDPSEPKEASVSSNAEQ